MSVVRNIYNRLISIYLYNKSKSGRKVQNFNKCNCNDFLNYIKYRINSYIEVNINDCHYIPQWGYAKNVIYILKYEIFSLELNELFEKFNIKNFNISKKINQSSSKCIEGNNITINCFDEELLRLVNDVYNEDFVNLKYKKYFKRYA